MGPNTVAAGTLAAQRSRRSAVTAIVAAIVIQMMTAPGQTAGVSVFIGPISAELDISRSGIAGAYLLGTAISAVSMPFAGRLIDRRGVRWATVMFGAAFGASLTAMAGVGSLGALAVAFAATRMLGQGALSLTSTTVATIGFGRNRGLALGFRSAAGSALMSLVPLAAAVMIAAWGWRLALVALGAAVAAVLVPLGLLVVVDPRFGAAPPLTDTAVPLSTDDAAAAPLPAARRYDGALSHPMFWVSTAALALVALTATGLVFHQIELLGERGFTRAQAAANFLPQTAAVAVAGMIAGRLADRRRPGRLLAAGLILLVLASTLAQTAAPGATGVLYAVALGAALGVIGTVHGAAIPLWFGINNVAGLRGVSMAVTVGSSATGPLILATSRGVLGSYGPVLNLLSLFAAAIAVACTVISEPSSPTEQGAPSAA